ncbi:MAG: hypothetical protein HYW70_02150 [Candidatus Nealsonbacteria bacterium]|nr:hypothetical protein [Candidatus Nealsonbacteria bacterium]
MKSVVFCSSQRFKKELEEFMVKLSDLAEEKGVNLAILHPEFESDGWPEDFYKLSEEERLKNTNYRRTVMSKVYDHLFRKIRAADVCYVFNKDGYLGPNTIGDLFTAAALGKMVYSLEEECKTGEYPKRMHEEPCCRGLIHKVIPSPEELIKYLL